MSDHLGQIKKSTYIFDGESFNEKKLVIYESD